MTASDDEYKRLYDLAKAGDMDARFKLFRFCDRHDLPMPPFCILFPTFELLKPGEKQNYSNMPDHVIARMQARAEAEEFESIARMLAQADQTEDESE